MSQALSQVALGLVPAKRIAEPALISIEVIARIKSKRDAYRRCVDEGIRAGYVATQAEVAAYLDIEAGQFNRILNESSRHLDADKENLLERVCGNKIPTQWQAYQDGYELKLMKSKLEVDLEHERARTAELEKKLDHLAEFLKMARG